MINVIKLFFLFLFLISCSNETIYSGKILNQEDFNDINYKDKQTLINKLGNPSFVDPLEKKFFYYLEKKNINSIFNKEVEYSYVFVFKFDQNDKILNSEVFDLKNSKNIEIIKNQTSNEVVKMGLLERIFGGVGSQQEFPTTP